MIGESAVVPPRCTASSSRIWAGGLACALGLSVAAAGWSATLKYFPNEYRVQETQLAVTVTLVIDAPDCVGEPKLNETTVTVRAVESAPVSASAGQDFNSKTYKIPIGGDGPAQVTRALESLLIDDSRHEGIETFRLTLEDAPSQVGCSGGGPVPLTVDPAGATVLIDDPEDTSSQEVRFERSSFTVDELAATAITVVRSGTEGSVAVDYTLTAGTAEDGDFSPPSGTIGTITFPAGSGRQSFQVQALGDDDFDDETVILSLANPRPVSGGTQVGLGSPAQATLEIRDVSKLPESLQKEEPVPTIAKPGDAVDLKVKASTSEGPIRRATVTWEIEVGKSLASFVDGPTSQTGEDGVATKRVRMTSGTNGGAVRISARLADPEKKVQFDLNVSQPLGDLAPAGSGAASVGRSIDELCKDPGQEENPLCTYFFHELEPEEQGAALDELDGEELGSTETLALGGVGDQMRNLGSRLAALRGGSSRLSVQHLALQIQGKPVDPGTIAAVIAARDPTAALKAAVDQKIAALDQNGQDDQETAEATEPASPAAPRLGVFLNGRVSFGKQEDRSAEGGEAGFDFDTRGLTGGVDYRLSDSLFLGIAAGLLSTNTDLTHDGGALDAQGESLSMFGLYQPGANLYYQGTLTYGHSDYDMTRNLDMPGVGIKSARSSTGGTQLAAGFDIGGGRQLQAHTINGVGRVSYVKADIDSYRERGADPFNVEVEAQDITSLQSELGLEWVYTGQFQWGLLRPMLRFSYLHEYEADSRLIRGRFLIDPNDHFFSIPTNRPDRDFFNAGLTLQAQTLHGTIFMSYDQELGRSDLTTGTVTFGLRQDF